jgi:hypothetical protein
MMRLAPLRVIYHTGLVPHHGAFENWGTMDNMVTSTDVERRAQAILI